MATAPELLLPIPEIGIRPMDESDVEAVACIERACYQFPWSENIFRDCLRVGYVCRVLEIGGVLIGHGILSIGAGEAHVLNVCVRPEYRCRGLGRRLLEYLLLHPCETLSHDQLVEAVWDGRVVSDEAVRRAVSTLRHALAADGSDRC